MNAQILKTMNLIIDISTSHERAALGIFVTTVEQCHRVWHISHTVVSVWPGSITIVVRSHRPLEIASEVAQGSLEVTA